MIKCIGAIIYDRDKDMVLLQQRCKNTTYALKWGLWGGKLERKEDFIDGLLRELKEELTNIPEIIELKPVETFVSEDGEFIYYTFLIITDNYNGFQISENETNDCVWLPLDKVLKIDLHPATKKMFNEKIHLIKKYINSHLEKK